MAKTIKQWEQVLIDAKDADADLDGLTDNSVVAKWKRLIGYFAQAANLLEGLWDAKKIELEAIAAASQAGTDQWYAARIKEWQYGYALTEQDGKLSYLINDDDAKLVAAVAVISGSPLQIKVAKLNGSNLEPLTLAELVSLNFYIQDIKFAGTNHELYSSDADEVTPTAICYYDGKLDFATVKTAVELTLNNHLTGIYFNGKVNINRYRDAAEAMTEVVDFDITQLQARPHGGSYTVVTREYAARSGYFKHSTGWESGITYVPV